MMEEPAIYGNFAAVYDLLMADVPYDRWAREICNIIKRYGVSRPVDPKKRGRRSPLEEERDLVVDLGCGTGNLTRRLKDAGYDLMGIDRSPDMLAVAMDKDRKASSGKKISYLCQDMRRLDLYCTAGTFVSVCDSVNYLLTDRDVLSAFGRVNRFLYPGGIFVFDFNTVHKYRDILGARVIAESGDQASFIWENRFRPRGNRNDAEISFFLQEEDGRYRRFTETHVQRGFTLQEMKGFLKQAGLEYLTALDERTWRRPHAGSERIFVVARERGKDRR